MNYTTWRDDEGAQWVKLAILDGPPQADWSGYDRRASGQHCKSEAAERTLGIDHPTIAGVGENTWRQANSSKQGEFE